MENFTITEAQVQEISFIVEDIKDYDSTLAFQLFKILLKVKTGISTDISYDELTKV